MRIAPVQSLHRLLAVDLIWRTFDRPFKNRAEYEALVREIAGRLALGRLVIMRRQGNEITVTSRK